MEQPTQKPASATAAATTTASASTQPRIEAPNRNAICAPPSMIAATTLLNRITRRSSNCSAASAAAFCCLKSREPAAKIKLPRRPNSAAPATMRNNSVVINGSCRTNAIEIPITNVQRLSFTIGAGIPVGSQPAVGENVAIAKPLEGRHRQILVELYLHDQVMDIADEAVSS